MASLYIDREECIGDSLVKINNNFSGLDTDITTLNTRVTNTSAAAITLTTNLSTNLQNTSPGMAKAWVYFFGQGSNGNCAISARYNVSTVVRNSVGSYTITYTNPIPLGGVVVGNSGGVSSVSYAGPIYGSNKTANSVSISVPILRSGYEGVYDPVNGCDVVVFA